jgi:hypothetical protein
MIKLCRLQRRAPVQNFAPSVTMAVRNAASAEALRHPLPLPESGDVPWAMLERVAEARIAIDQTVLVLKAADDG